MVRHRNRSHLTLILTPFLLTSILQAAVPIIRVMGASEDGGAEHLTERASRGENLQFLLLIPEGDLLDPDTVRVEVDGDAIDHHLYYKMANLAIVFVLPPQDESTTKTLSVVAGTVGTPARSEWQGAVGFVADPPIRTGRNVRFLDEDENPIEDVLVFGQRRSDLLARSRADGTVPLDRPTRSNVPIHVAWKEGLQTRHFDPIDTHTLTLLPAAQAIPVTFAPKFSGQKPDKALFHLEPNHFAFLDETVTLPEPADREQPVFMIVPGYLPAALPWKEAIEGAPFPLRLEVEGVN